MVERFTISIPQESIDDLNRRLERVRWPGDLENEAWQYGANERYLQELVSYWRDRYDWRRHEAAMNQYDHYRVTLDGQPIHFLHIRNANASAPTLLLNHGWPWTFWDFHKVIPELADGFNLVIPSLPGYGFSTPLTRTGLGFVATSDLFHKLMTQVLGIDAYLAYGGDWGALIAEQLAYKYPEHVKGLFVTMPYPLNFAPADPGLWQEDEKELAERTAWWAQQDSAYFQEHVTKPQTVAFMSDSPVAMAAWIVEKIHGWTDYQNDFEEAYSREDLLTTLSIFWHTNTLGSSARFYAESLRNPWTGDTTEPVISVPTGIAIFDKEVALYPRKWAERYFNLKAYNRVGPGGHFPAVENPKELANQLKRYFLG